MQENVQSYLRYLFIDFTTSNDVNHLELKTIFLMEKYTVIFRSLCQKHDIAVIEFAPTDEVLSLASEADVLPLTGKNDIIVWTIW